MNKQNLIAAIGLSIAGIAGATTTAAAATPPVKNIVLVHGAFADGTGWRNVSEILVKDGYTVSVVQEPQTSLADDVAATNRVIEQQSGPTLLVGHSYGGTIITEAGNNPKVAGLVYLAAFAPDAGESTLTLAKQTPAASTSIRATKDGFLYLDVAQFPGDFAADLPENQARFMATSQVMPAAAAFGAPVASPAWKSKPSWAVVATDDRVINPDLERFMSKRADSKTVEIKSSHSLYISHAAEVANVIEKAALGSGR